MVTFNNFFDNKNIVLKDQLGCFNVYEHQADLSVTPGSAVVAYYMREMNVRKRQILCNLQGNAVKVQAGAMQWTTGNIQMDSGVHSVGGFLGKAIKGAVTGESAAKPIYGGIGFLMLEPTYRHIILVNVADWGGGIVLDDGLFLACDNTLQEQIVKRNSLASAVVGGEGIFNLSLIGNGVAALESAVPKEELIEVVLENDEIRIDGNMAIAWSASLQFTSEKSTKSLIGSAVSGEGFVNVFRGTGKILMAPTADGATMRTSNGPQQQSSSGLGSIVKAFG